MFFTSCARKVYFLEANKIEYLNAEESVDTDLEFASYFAGDAIDYIIFEMDLKNRSDDTLTVSYKDISLRIENMKTSEVINWEPLWKENVIKSLDDIQSEERVNKRARDIGNAFDLGLNLLMIGTNGYRAVDAIFYSMDVASVMMEDARSHKLLTGSLEE
ncbi:MAG: hypothetical protein HKO89_06570, partial [Saprospiraceae bacterium]|nr:hypothetical protein [Saprospiraceae bacterium]